MRFRDRAFAVQTCFAENRALFETVEVAGVAFDDRVEAENLCRALREDRADLPVAIPDSPHILEEPADDGYFGLVTRADLPPEFSEALFKDDPGECVGPVAFDGRFWVFHILMPRRAELNEAVYEYCEMLLDSSGGT